MNIYFSCCGLDDKWQSTQETKNLNLKWGVIKLNDKELDKSKKMRPKIKRASNCWAKRWEQATSEESKKVSNQKLEKWKLLLKWGKKQGMAWGARKEVRRCLSSGTSVGKSLREPRSPWSCSSSSLYLQWAQVSQRHIKHANANENKERNQQTHTILIYRVKRNKRNKTPPYLWIRNKKKTRIQKQMQAKSCTNI